MLGPEPKYGEATAHVSFRMPVEVANVYRLLAAEKSYGGRTGTVMATVLVEGLEAGHAGPEYPHVVEKMEAQRDRLMARVDEMNTTLQLDQESLREHVRRGQKAQKRLRPLRPYAQLVEDRGLTVERMVLLKAGRAKLVPQLREACRMEFPDVVAHAGGGVNIQVVEIQESTGTVLFSVRLPGSVLAAIDHQRARLRMGRHDVTRTDVINTLLRRHLGVLGLDPRLQALATVCTMYRRRLAELRIEIREVRRRIQEVRFKRRLAVEQMLLLLGLPTHVPRAMTVVEMQCRDLLQADPKCVVDDV